MTLCLDVVKQSDKDPERKFFSAKDFVEERLETATNGVINDCRTLTYRTLNTATARAIVANHY